MGRPYLGYNEMVKIRAAEGMAMACLKKANSDNWAEWAQDNPTEAKQLAEIEKSIAEEELDDG
jgi:hypothetical protein